MCLTSKTSVTKTTCITGLVLTTEHPDVEIPDGNHGSSRWGRVSAWRWRGGVLGPTVRSGDNAVHRSSVGLGLRVIRRRCPVAHTASITVTVD